MASEAPVPFVTLGTAESYLRVAALSVFAYDWLTTLPTEVRLYRKQPWPRPSFRAVSYFLARYSAALLLAVTMSAYFDTHFNIDCAAWSYLMAASRSFATMSAMLVLIWRTCAIWPSKWVKAVVWAFLLARMAVSIVGIVKLAPPLSLPGTHNCVAAASHLIPAYLTWVMTMIFDLLCFVLVAVRLAQTSAFGTWAAFPRFIWRGSCAYMFGSLLLSVGNTICFALPASYKASTTLTALTAVLMSILAQRLVTSLEEFKRENVLDPLRSHSGSRKGSRPTTAVFNVPVLMMKREVVVEVDKADDPGQWRADRALGELPRALTSSLPPFARCDRISREEDEMAELEFSD